MSTRHLADSDWEMIQSPRDGGHLASLVDDMMLGLIRIYQSLIIAWRDLRTVRSIKSRHQVGKPCDWRPELQLIQ